MHHLGERGLRVKERSALNTSFNSTCRPEFNQDHAMTLPVFVVTNIPVQLDISTYQINRKLTWLL